MTSAFAQLRVYQNAEALADVVWDSVVHWDNFSRDTVGKQLVRSADSIGTNIAEGHGRGSALDNRRFVKIARGSMNETVHHLRRAFRRGLLTEEQTHRLKPLLDHLPRQINAYLRNIRVTPSASPSKPTTSHAPHAARDIQERTSAE
jgi:four helix bundle protein